MQAPQNISRHATLHAGAMEEPPMLHATMHAVDIALYILPAVFALMIAYDFVLYVKAQRRAAKSAQRVSAKPQSEPQQPCEPEPIKLEPSAAPTEQPQQPTYLSELQEPALPDLSSLKLYKLHNHTVVLTADLLTPPPSNIKLYKLRGKECLRLKDLEAYA
ncbi:hypothetical protein H6F93_01910 [Leptolyngbya sp. FACHB-671]|uniref:hypothetical protein n=1 Tax=Leptolyngbya sp. FACHB-671 TaxID=2692812 RepID=UPI00168700B4|nr:hypothetical protein [Leptolyngbya sp. FACHB-671]MBD2066293.1 hypothetical protein [Leptolyngbya sp. FACHB-671]